VDLSIKDDARFNCSPRTIFNSLEKGKDGEWKFIVDLGISKTPPFNDELYRFNSGAASFVPGTLKNLLTAEENFIRQTKDAETAVRKKQYEDVLSKKAFFLNCTGNLPATGLAEINKVLQTMPQKIGYAIDGSGISAAGDLGYVYGTTIINTQPENYLRIWRREGRDWKLVLEVLRY
jgi:ketosteroid isomerase-like protein